jgi:hypothetical protein
MKRYGFTTKSVTNYEDDQIVIPVADAKCLNVAHLVEHASMSLFKPLDEFAVLYKALGHEFGIGHLSSTETILVLNLFDIQLSDRIQGMRMPEDSVETFKVLEDEWAEIRHEFVKAKLEARVKLSSKKYVAILPCAEIKRFEFPQAFSSK